jgi:hypothetical protein
VGGVPWRRAGPGWLVVEFSAARWPSPGRRPEKAPATFYLVSPAGRKYPFYRTAATAYPQLQLVDWSGDRQRILVAAEAGSDQRAVVEQISLVSGAVISRFSLPTGVLPLAYTRPRGSSLLAAPGPGRQLGMLQFGLDGRRQRVLAPGPMLSTPGGRVMVVGTASGLELASSTGAVTRRIAIPGSADCRATRWWTATTVLAACFRHGPYATRRLWLVPIAGVGQPRPLTPALRPRGLFMGYIGAWQLPGRLYLLADNAHDTLSVVRQYRDGTRRTITIPGPDGVSDLILTSQAGRLLLQSNIGGPGGPSSLFWYNPATGSVRYIVRTPPGVYGVAGAIPYRYRTGLDITGARSVPVARAESGHIRVTGFTASGHTLRDDTPPFLKRPSRRSARASGSGGTWLRAAQ